MPKHLQAGAAAGGGLGGTYPNPSVTGGGGGGGGGSGNALSFTNLTSGGGAATTNAITASVAPTANKLLLLSVSIRNGATVQPTTPTVSGNGLTWVLVDHADLDITTSSRRSVFLFRAMGAAPTAGAITITFGETETDAAWSLDQVTGADTGGSNGSAAIVQHVSAADTSGASSSLSVTLGAVTRLANAIYGVFGTDGTATPTAGTGFTLLGHGASGANETVDTEYDLSSTTAVAMSWGGTGQLGGIAVEITSDAVATPGTSKSFAIAMAAAL